MSEAVLCTGCGKALAAGSPGGLCPGCLLRLALEGTQGEESTLAAPEGSSGPEDLGSVGPYKLLSILGEGGMGSVYLAEQSEPIRRRVALKVIKRGMDTKDVIARFESERQALALMSHQNIARVLDAGTTKDGLPYFVMEHVAGVPITEYCDKNRLDSRSRLELFEQVCLAVQHAHQKGIIHRDIKPSNVLVSEEEGTPRPRIIDFGVAKAVNQRLTEKTLFTQRGVIVGTPGYMSPEQADPTALDVDIRTDIYSLGVLLYEIVAGVPPFDPKRLLSAGWGEMQRIIREEEPPKPSTRVSKLGDTATGVAQRRGTNPGTLERELRGEIDWIALKALEKDPARRYQSATEFSADIRHYLAEEPVLAGPPSNWYRASKYASRHKIGVTFVGSLALLVIGFAVTMAVMASRLAKERDRASQEAAIAKEVEKFLLGMFENPNPEVSRGSEITARELLDRGVVQIETLKAQPRVQVRLLTAMGGSYEGLGLPVRAREAAERALRINAGVPDPDAAVTRTIRFNLASVMIQTGALDDAEKGFRAIYDDEVAAGRGGEFAAYEALSGLGTTLQRAGRFADAEGVFRKALDGLQRTGGRDNYRTLEALNGLAIVRGGLGDFVEAERLQRAAYEGRVRTFGAESPVTMEAMTNLGYDLMQLGRNADAEPLLRSVYERQRKMLGDDHPSMMATINGLATLLQSLERYGEAELLFERALAIVSKGSDDPLTIVALNNLAVVRMLQERWQEAIDPIRRASVLAGKVFPPDSPSAIMIESNLGETLGWLGSPREGSDHVDRALGVARKTWPDGNAVVGRILRKKATVLMNAREYEAAELAALEASEMLEKLAGPAHFHTRMSIKTLITLYERWGREPQARQWREKLASLQSVQAGAPQATPVVTR